MGYVRYINPESTILLTWALVKPGAILVVIGFYARYYAFENCIEYKHCCLNSIITVWKFIFSLWNSMTNMIKKTSRIVRSFLRKKTGNPALIEQPIYPKLFLNKKILRLAERKTKYSLLHSFTDSISKSPPFFGKYNKL